jgi:hypothetical protein
MLTTRLAIVLQARPRLASSARNKQTVAGLEGIEFSRFCRHQSVNTSKSLE